MPWRSCNVTVIVIVITATSNDHHDVSNHRQFECLFYHLFRLTTKEHQSSSLHVMALCEGNPPVTGGFPSQRASNAKKFPFDDVIMVTPRRSNKQNSNMIHWKLEELGINRQYCSYWWLGATRGANTAGTVVKFNWCMYKPPPPPPPPPPPQQKCLLFHGPLFLPWINLNPIMDK